MYAGRGLRSFLEHNNICFRRNGKQANDAMTERWSLREGGVGLTSLVFLVMKCVILRMILVLILRMIHDGNDNGDDKNYQNKSNKDDNNGQH